MRIAIIGFGVAGISVLREIKKQAKDQRDSFDITVFSDRESMGTGFPYQADDEVLVINQYTETMSLDPENPHDFMQWIEKTDYDGQLKHTHLPRPVFGSYLIGESQELIEDLNVRVVYETVSKITALSQDKFQVLTQSGAEEFEIIHLSVGHLAYQDPFNLKGENKFIYNPYPATKQLKLKEGPTTVGIVGTGLTAIDTFLYLQKHRPEINVAFLSLDQRFSSVRGNESEIILKRRDQITNNIKELVANNNYELTLQHVITWIKKETTDCGIDLSFIWKNLGEGTLEAMNLDLAHLNEIGKFQTFIRVMRESYILLWLALSDSDKDRFVDEFGRKWSNFKAPIPQQTARILIKAFSEKRVHLHSGITSIKKEKEAFNVRFDNGEMEAFEYIINATGQQLDLTEKIRLQQPLIKNLVHAGLLVPYQYGGVLIDSTSMLALNSRKEKRSGFYVYGQLASGIYYGNNNVELIVKSAQVGVKDMLKNNFE